MSGINQKRPFFAWPILLIALFAVSSAGTILQSMEEIPPFLRASWRMQGTSFILLPLFLFQIIKSDAYKLSVQDAKLLFLSSIFLALHFGSWVWSLDNTSLVHSLLFVTTHPIIIVLMMPILGSSVSKSHIVGAFLGVFGAIITFGDIEKGSEITFIGDLAAFMGAVTVVGYMFIGRHLRSKRQMPVFVYAFPVTFGAGIWLAFSALLFEPVSISDTVPESELFGWMDSVWLLWVFYLSLGPGLAGHTGINTVLKWFPPILVSVVLLFEPVIGGLIGWLFTDQITLGYWTLLGGPIMLIGAIIVTIEENNVNITRNQLSDE
ncbi:MAG: DMT family transporter [Candidatus Thalassarchaeaceae archaeon]|jgi:drug/metabolite transporter (DMT)-like permease